MIEIRNFIEIVFLFNEVEEGSDAADFALRGLNDDLVVRRRLGSLAESGVWQKAILGLFGARTEASGARTGLQLWLELEAALRNLG